MGKVLTQSILLFCALTTLFGCASRKAFTTSAQAGDTVVLNIGWFPDVARNDLTLTLTDSLGSQVTYFPGDPAVHSVVNLYPDPLSKLIVESELGIFPVSVDVNILNLAVTGGDMEFSQKFMMIDLPTTLSTGETNIDIVSTTGDTINPLKVEILPGLGSSNTFANWNGWTLNDSHLQYMERPSYYAVDFSSATIPHAIQIDIIHNPDGSNGGIGAAFVTNVRADLKSISWSDNGTNMLRVILMPSSGGLADMQHFSFYVAGGLTGVLPGTVTAFDINGNSVSGVTANITAKP